MMKTVLHLSLCALATLYVAGPALAAADTAQMASACHTVQDADARAFCLARAHRDPARCYSVQAPDRRALCRAEASR